MNTQIRGMILAVMLVILILCMPSISHAQESGNVKIPSIRHGSLTESVGNECRSDKGCPNEDLSQPHVSSGDADNVLPSSASRGFDFGGLCSLVGGANNACLMLLDCAGVTLDKPCPITDCYNAITASSAAERGSASDYTRKYDERCRRRAGCAEGDVSCDPCPNGYYVTSDGKDSRCTDIKTDADWCDEDGNFLANDNTAYVIAAACQELCTLDPSNIACAMMQCAMQPGPKCCAVTPVAECCELFDLAEEVIECIDNPSPECCEILSNKTVNRYLDIPEDLVTVCKAIVECSISIYYYDKYGKRMTRDQKINFITGAEPVELPEYDKDGNQTGSTKLYKGIKECCGIYPGFKKTCEGLMCLVNDFADGKPCPSKECCQMFPVNPYCKFCRCYESMEKKDFEKSAKNCCALVDTIANTDNSDIVGDKIPDEYIEPIKNTCKTIFECYKAVDSLSNQLEDGDEPCYWINDIEGNGCERRKPDGTYSECANCNTALHYGEAPKGTTPGWYADSRSAVTKLRDCCDSVAGSVVDWTGVAGGDTTGVMKWSNYGCGLMDCYINPGIRCCSVIPPEGWEWFKDKTAMDCAFLFKCLINPIVSTATDPNPAITINNVQSYTEKCCDEAVGVFSNLTDIYGDRLEQSPGQIPVCAGIQCFLESLEIGQTDWTKAPFNMKCCEAIPPTMQSDMSKICALLVYCRHNLNWSCCDKVVLFFQTDPFQDWVCPDGLADSPYADTAECATARAIQMLPTCSQIFACYDVIDSLVTQVNSIPEDNVFTLELIQAFANTPDSCCSMADKVIKEYSTLTRIDSEGNEVPVEISICKLKEMIKCLYDMTPSCCATLMLYKNNFGLEFSIKLTDANSITSDEIVKVCEALVTCYRSPGVECCALFSVSDQFAYNDSGNPTKGTLGKLSSGLSGYKSPGGMERMCRNFYECYQNPTSSCCTKFPGISNFLEDQCASNDVINGLGLSDVCKCAVKQCQQLLDCAVETPRIEEESRDVANKIYDTGVQLYDDADSLIDTGQISGDDTWSNFSRNAQSINEMRAKLLPAECCSALENLGKCCTTGVVCDAIGKVNKVLDLAVCNPIQLPPSRPDTDCYDPNSGFEGCECQRLMGGRPTDELEDKLGIDELELPKVKPLDVGELIHINDLTNDPIDENNIIDDSLLPPGLFGNENDPVVTDPSSSSGTGTRTFSECFLWDKLGVSEFAIMLGKQCKVGASLVLDVTIEYPPVTSEDMMHLNVTCASYDDAGWQNCVLDNASPYSMDVPFSFLGERICRIAPGAVAHGGGGDSFGWPGNANFCVDVPALAGPVVELDYCWGKHVNIFQPDVGAVQPTLQLCRDCQIQDGIILNQNTACTVADDPWDWYASCNKTVNGWNLCSAKPANIPTDVWIRTADHVIIPTEVWSGNTSFCYPKAGYTPAEYVTNFCVETNDLIEIPSPPLDECWVIRRGLPSKQELQYCRDCVIEETGAVTSLTGCNAPASMQTINVKCSKSPGVWTNCYQNNVEDKLIVPEEFGGTKKCFDAVSDDGLITGVISNFCVDVPRYRLYEECWYLDGGAGNDPDGAKVQYCTECNTQDGVVISANCAENPEQNVTCQTHSATEGWLDCSSFGSEAQVIKAPPIYPAHYEDLAGARTAGTQWCLPKVGSVGDESSPEVENYCVDIPLDICFSNEILNIVGNDRRSIAIHMGCAFSGNALDTIDNPARYVELQPWDAHPIVLTCPNPDDQNELSGCVVADHQFMPNVLGLFTPLNMPFEWFGKRICGPLMDGHTAGSQLVTPSVCFEVPPLEYHDFCIYRYDVEPVPDPNDLKIFLFKKGCYELDGMSMDLYLTLEPGIYQTQNNIINPLNIDTFGRNAFKCDPYVPFTYEAENCRPHPNHSDDTAHFNYMDTTRTEILNNRDGNGDFCAPVVNLDHGVNFAYEQEMCFRNLQ